MSGIVAATLFSGIGAPEVAMPHWQWRWHAEIEKFPSAVMAARHPQSINLGDVTAHDFTQRAEAIARPDVLVFGSPCQSFSVAGKRLGLDDPRGNLALVALGIVDRLKPRWFVFENVPGLFSSYSGSEHAESEIRDRAKRGDGQVGESVDAEEDRDIAAFVARVQDIRYSGAWGVLDAQWRGVAQRRERVFFVGHIGDWRYPAAVLLEPESLCGNSPPSRETGQTVAKGLSVGAGGSSGHQYRQRGNEDQLVGFNNTGQGWWTEDEVAAGMRDASAGGASHATVVAHALNAKGGSGRIDGESETFIAYALRGEGFDASEDGTGRGTPIVAFQCHGSNVGEMGTLRAGNGNHTGGVPFVQTTADTITAFWERSKGAKAGNQVGLINPIIYPSSVRRLTPRECERLQSFPDDYTLIRYPTHSARTGLPLKRPRWVADGPRYKACGNSMNVEVIRWILARIEIFETQVRPIIEARAA